MRKICVYAGWMDTIPLIGTVYAEPKRSGGEVFSFQYDETWLKAMAESAAGQIDPELPMIYGRQHLTDPFKLIFGIFSDACPDRWGRRLIQREDKENGAANRQLLESDYLLAVDDRTRMGALRFKVSPEGDFLAENSDHPIPPVTDIRSLEAASIAFENRSPQTDLSWLKVLFEQGSSLGGARPKANILDTDGSLWMAKFPSVSDEYDVGAWEMVAHDLAKLCGIEVMPARLMRLSSHGSTYLTKRYDRTGGKRVHFQSAMTMLGTSDREAAEKPFSYLDIGDRIEAVCADPQRELRSLWQRMTFNTMICNTDDHLRNHGFLWKDEKWQLSPAYDLNINLYRDNHQLTIDGEDAGRSFDLDMSVAEYFGVQESEAEAYISGISRKASQNVKRLAGKYGVRKAELQDMTDRMLLE